jgi:hypothetical protein
MSQLRSVDTVCRHGFATPEIVVATHHLAMWMKASRVGHTRNNLRAIDHILQHMVMARREVLVQLDDDLIAQLDTLVRRRSETTPTPRAALNNRVGYSKRRLARARG